MTPVSKVVRFGGVILPLFMSGCIGTKKAETAGLQQTAEKKVLGPTEYEYVYMTGSHIPVRVPKSSTARPLPSANPVTTYDAESFERMIRRGQRTSTSPRFR